MESSLWDSCMRFPAGTQSSLWNSSMRFPAGMEFFFSVSSGGLYRLLSVAVTCRRGIHKPNFPFPKGISSICETSTPLSPKGISLLHFDIKPRPVLVLGQQVVIMADVLLSDFLAVDGDDLVADLVFLFAVE